MTNVERGPGRPPLTGRSDGKLHAPLLDLLPERLVSDGRVNVAALSLEVGCAKYTTYRWMSRDHLTGAAATALRRVEGNALAVADLAPFMLD